MAPWLVVLALLPAASAWEGRLELDAPGVYRVTAEELFAAGLAPGWPSWGLEVRRRGSPVPVSVEDGGDGTFDDGDVLDLVHSQSAAGDATRAVYQIRWAPHSATRMRRSAGACGWRSAAPMDAGWGQAK